jgi:pimeloyl-ACP methyl ester carboxylesterase
MRQQLVAIPTDTHPLDGCFYEPEDEACGVVQILHGNCHNFYTGPSRFLPPALVDAGYAVLAYNRRGHDILGTLNSRQTVGGALQTFAQARADNRYARTWLMENGFGPPIIVGHSHGGMLAAQHAADHPDTPTAVIMSAHAGGPGIMDKVCAAGLMAGPRLAEMRRTAEELVAAGRGEEFLLFPDWWHVATAAAFLDYADNLPETATLAPRIACRSLFLRGTLEPAGIYPGEAFAAASQGRCTFRPVDGGDHFYTGVEAEVARIIVGWLADVVKV